MLGEIKSGIFEPNYETCMMSSISFSLECSLNIKGRYIAGAAMFSCLLGVYLHGHYEIVDFSGAVILTY